MLVWAKMNRSTLAEQIRPADGMDEWQLRVVKILHPATSGIRLAQKISPILGAQISRLRQSIRDASLYMTLCLRFLIHSRMSSRLRR